MKAQNILFLTACLFMLFACDNGNKSESVDSYTEGGDVEWEAEVAEAAADYKAEEAQSTYQETRKNESNNNGYLLNTTQGTAAYAVADVSDNDVTTSTDANQKPVMRTNDKIIKKGSVGIQVKDYNKDKHHFEDAIRKYDGYKSNENEKTELSRISNTIEMRLPNQNFDQFINEITTGKGIKNVDYKRTSATDVGEEYMDLMTRIRTKKEVEKRYIEILRKANKITDILAVEDQIRVIREEIESKEGRLRFLQDRISYSTVSLYIYENLEYDAPLVDKPTFWGKMANAANTGWNLILNFLLFLVYIWPIVLMLVITIVLYKKKLFLFKNRK